MHLTEIHDPSVWDSFASAQPFAQFSQSWAWGAFQKSCGHAVKRFFFAKSDGEPTVAACQLIYYKRRMTGYWFAPRGPILSDGTLLDEIVCEMSRLHLPHPSLFVRLEPPVTSASVPSIPSVLRRQHMMSPTTTRVIDLTLSEEELLSAMHQKTRYNIHLAERHGVTVRESVAPEDVEMFLKLTDETAARDEFTSHDAEYLRATVAFLSKSGMARIRLAEKDGTVLAANMEMVFGDTATYLHGASSSTSRQLMAPFLLQWEAMRAAKADGRNIYDLWGCNPEDEAAINFKPSWEGISRFKRGFGGRLVDFVGTYDLPKHPWIYQLIFRN